MENYIIIKIPRAKAFWILITVSLFLLVLIFIKSSAVRIICQREVDNHKLFSDTQNQWNPITEIDPQQANLEYNICLHRFGE